MIRSLKLLLALACCIGATLTAMSQTSVDTSKPASVTVATPAASSTTPSDQTMADLMALEKDITAGSLSNLTVAVGVSYQEGGKNNRLGGCMLIGYNLPKLPIPFVQPYAVPLFGASYRGGSWNSVSVNVAAQADYHPLRLFDGGSTNGFTHDFQFTANGIIGAEQNISGSQFGNVTVPGKKPENGRGLAGITGYGASFGVGSIKGCKIGLWGERLTISTAKGIVDEVGLFVAKRI